MTLKVGFATPTKFWTSTLDEKQATLAKLADAGVDHIYMADHVSFRDGMGTDGFIEVAALSQLHPNLGVMISVYLLALRHPLPVARQIATMSKVAPGRFILGVGIGGDDRHEIEVCGVDPQTRGKRTDESLDLLNQLMTGESVDFKGEFFNVESARIRPKIEPAIPIIVGGRSDAALNRAARFGDGWIGAWCSPRRFGQALGIIETAAQEIGRTNVHWQHGYQPWVGVGETEEKARELVAKEMEAFYQVPFAAFEKYVPVGTPAMVAESLSRYVHLGCELLNLKVVAEHDSASIEAGAEIIERLRG